MSSWCYSIALEKISSRTGFLPYEDFRRRAVAMCSTLSAKFHDGGSREDIGRGGDRRFYGGSPGVLKPTVVVIKKEPRRPRDRDATGIGCVLPKAGKRRDGARGSGANDPAMYHCWRFRHPVPVAIFIRRDRTEVNDDSTESEKLVERKRRARRKRVRPRLPVDVWCQSAQVAVLSKYSCWSLACSSIETLFPSTGSCPGGCREVVRKYKMSWSSARPPR
ncbi:hypothetical protein ALC53_04200 [Atta colombica]|uniref:Uncharacterized protein n=1 Tax=Atta colombica TaxID=520822 RepID=A0A195BM85_9HYME|nr:hypothetical protein ALC53_04200 [Atta colombica]